MEPTKGVEGTELFSLSTKKDDILGVQVRRLGTGHPCGNERQVCVCVCKRFIMTTK